MAFYDKFPYTNLHELNLDWIMKEVSKVRDNRDASDASAAAALASEQAAKASETAAAASQQAAAESEQAAAGSEAASAEYLEQIGTHTAGAVADWLEENLQPTTPPVDESLTVSGAAADAKVTGDRISDLNQAVNSIRENENLFDSASATSGKRLDAFGYLVDDANCYTSDLIEVKPGWKYYKKSPVEDNFHRVCIYTSTRNFISESASNFIDIPANGFYIRFCGLLTEINSAEVILNSAVDLVARNEAELYTTNMQDITTANDNLFDKNNAVDNTRISADGSESPENGYYTSAFIRVIPNAVYIKNSPVEDAYHRIAVYDEQQAFIAGELYPENRITIPETGAYIRFCGEMSEKDSAILALLSAKDIELRYELDTLHISNVAQTISMLGNDGIISRLATLSANAKAELASFPQYLKKNTILSFYGKFSTFSGLLFGKGYNSYRGDWVRITATDIIFHHYESTDTAIKTVPHNLTISDYLMAELFFDERGNLNCSINTTSGTFTTYSETDFNAFAGKAFVISLAEMNTVTLSASNGDIRKSFWVIGDSYFGLTADRVLGQLKALGFWNGYLADSLAGLSSQGAYAELNTLLRFGRPKYLIWYLGMNDSDSGFQAIMTQVKEYCERNEITLILNKVPTVPEKDNETIDGYVVQSGCRYIDSYAAVGADSSGNWYTGFLSGDNLHPTEIGAKALAMRILIDVPEIAQYGYKSTSVSGSSSGDH